MKMLEVKLKQPQYTKCKQTRVFRRFSFCTPQKSDTGNNYFCRFQGCYPCHFFTLFVEHDTHLSPGRFTTARGIWNAYEKIFHFVGLIQNAKPFTP